MRVEFGFYPMSTGHYDPTLPNITIKQWHKKVGDTVKKDEPILSLETDKLELELESPASGRIVEIYEDFKENGCLWISGDAEKLPDRRILYHPYLGVIETEEVEKAHIGEVPSGIDAGKEKSKDAPRIVITPAVRELARKQGISEEDLIAFAKKEHIERMGPEGFERFVAWRKSEQKEVSITEEDEGIRAVPAARALARENNIDLSEIRGTGDDGTITVADVEKHIAEIRAAEKVTSVSDAGIGDREPLHATQIRKTIAHLMTLSHQKIPKAGDLVDIKVTILREFIQKYKTWCTLWTEGAISLRYDHFFMYIATKLLMQQEFRILNAYWDEDVEDAYLFRHVNIGIAVQTESGLVVPVIHNAETLSFKRLIEITEEKIAKAHARKLTLHDIRDLTFTFNNPGAFGGKIPDSLIPYTIESNGKERPTGAILALGRAELDAYDRQFHANLVFRFDHRLFDGAPGILFVMAIKNYIESKKTPDDFLEIFSSDFTIE